MDLTCGNCGHKAGKVEFRFLSHAASAGADTYRQCPKCHCAVYCDEVEDTDYAGGKAWGTSGLRGRVFTRKTSERE